MGLFDKKQSFSRGELKKVLGRSSQPIPGTGGRRFNQRERERLERDTFSGKYGSEISKQDYRKALSEMNLARNKAKTSAEKVALDRKINFLKKLGGM